MTSYPRNNAKDPTIPEQADPRRLVEDVIREAEALIEGRSLESSEPVETPSTESEAIERVQGLTRGLEDLAAEVADLEASIVGDPGGLDMTAEAVERTPVVTTATPTVNLFASGESFPGAGEDSPPVDSSSEPTRLDRAVSNRVRQGYENIERFVADARRTSEPTSPPDTGEPSGDSSFDQALAAERAAMAAIDAELDSDIASTPPTSHLLRDTATNVDAKIGGLMPIEDGPEAEPIVMNTVTGDDGANGSRPISVVPEETPEPDDRSEAPVDSEDSMPEEDAGPDPDPSIEADEEIDSVDAEDVQAAPDSRTAQVVDRTPDDRRFEEPEPVDRAEPAALVLRIATKPMRVLPESIRPLTTALAASLVVWVPIAWAWAIFATEPNAPQPGGPALSAAVEVEESPTDQVTAVDPLQP